MSHARILAAPLFLCPLLFLGLTEVAAASEGPPGTVIHHEPAKDRRYIGSPSLCVLPNGDYLASHDFFGPNSREHERPTGRLYRSRDRGKTWKPIEEFEGFFWTGLFVHQRQVYALGTDRHHGRLVIRRSHNNAVSWTDAVVLADGEWATAPMPVIEHEGRLWRAVEDAHTGERWGERYRARMMSAPIDADLMSPGSWTFSNALASDADWLGGKCKGWLEGNAVVTPEGEIVNVLRVATPGLPEKAAIVRLSSDGATATFDPDHGFIDLPGASKKFTVRQDPDGGGYWTLANFIPERHAGQQSPASLRNTLALLHSEDLANWTVRTILLYHPDTARHGLQYADWQFDGDDLIAAVRTAHDEDSGDEEGADAHNAHDANYLTFHRWKDFRELQRSDDIPMPELPNEVFHETRSLRLAGPSFELGRLADEEKAFSNRKYVLEGVPIPLTWRTFTRLPGGARTSIEVKAKRTSKLTIATAVNQEPVDMDGWERTPLEFSYTDRGRTKLVVFERTLPKGKTLRLPRGNWTGSMLIFEED
ncbi:hypothetical protein Poly30_04140 [Planctomycetes bacterium Poly30]|uniref:BNR/Asp-box repeat protein n=1 Tax=Saltatorellus ferox TaxID=2528018 RepID=A0A518ELF3_9BACT|nr:hypothetical protein Poly30_04140 [Planctomycetes bacterium Poly30]